MQNDTAAQSENKITAGLIIIGDEILSGKTQDTNTQTLAKALNLKGIALSEVRVIPDNKAHIIDVVRHFHQHYDYVFTTGGIGPTHDDITAESIAEAFELPLEVHQASYDKLAAYYAERELPFNEARQKMVMLPQGASPIQNDVTIAPGIQIKNVYIMAGVPKIMQSMLSHLMPTLRTGAVVHSHQISTNLGESTMAADLTKLQKRYPEVSIGSYPKFDASSDVSVSLVFRHTDKAKLAEIREQIRMIITNHGGEIRDDMALEN